METIRQEPERRLLAQRWDYTNCSATVGLIGLLASGAFGVAEGAARRSWRGAIVGLVFGSFVCAVAGAGAGWLGRYVWDWVAPNLDEIPRGMLLQAMMWGSLGTVVGFSMALPTRRVAVMLRCAFATALAGLVSAMLFGILAAHFFPLENIALVVPRGNSRILWTVLTTALMGVLGGWYGCAADTEQVRRFCLNTARGFALAIFPTSSRRAASLSNAVSGGRVD